MFASTRDPSTDKARRGRMDVTSSVPAWISPRECTSVLPGNEPVYGYDMLFQGAPCVFCNDYVNAVTVIKFSFSTDVRPTPPSLQYVKCTMFLVNVVRRSDARPLRARRHPQSLADPPSGLISTRSVTTPLTTAKTTRRRWHVAESLNHGQDHTVT